MKHIVIFILKIICVIALSVATWIFVLVALVMWDVYYLEICDGALRQLFNKTQ
jgi:hypothetical protein